MWCVGRITVLLHRHHVFCSQRSSSSCQPVESFISSHFVLTFGIAGVYQLFGIIDMLVVVVLVGKGCHGRAGAGAGAGTGGPRRLCCGCFVVSHRDCCCRSVVSPGSTMPVATQADQNLVATITNSRSQRKGWHIVHPSSDGTLPFCLVRQSSKFSDRLWYGTPRLLDGNPSSRK